MDYINFKDSVGYLFLNDGVLPNHKHTVFLNHIKYDVPVLGCKVEIDDFFVRAIPDYKSWIFETYKVIDVDNDIAYIYKVDKKDCNIGIDFPIYAEDSLYREMQSYFDDLSTEECEIEYAVNGYNEDEYLELEISSKTILFKNGQAVNIIQERSQKDYKRYLSYKNKFYCSLQEGMIIASFDDNKAVYKIVQAVHHLSKIAIIRVVERSFIGEDIANKIDIAFNQQEEYIDQNAGLYLTLAFEQ